MRVLDPACGSGNFLYVTFEHLKRLEGEVLDALEGFGEGQDLLGLEGTTVDPHQLLGIEVNPACSGDHRHGALDRLPAMALPHKEDLLTPEPVIKKFRNIECRDAVLVWDSIELVLEEDGKPVTRWNGITTKAHPVDRVSRYPTRRIASRCRSMSTRWQGRVARGDFVVGNPPFIGNWRMSAGPRRRLRRSAAQDLQGGAGEHRVRHVLVAQGGRADPKGQGSGASVSSPPTAFRRPSTAKSFSTTWGPSRRSRWCSPSPTIPWVDSADGAAVRIAMTVGQGGELPGTLQRVTGERSAGGEGLAVDLQTRTGKLFADLTIGANVAGAEQLRANADLCAMGVKLHGEGFQVAQEETTSLGLGRIPGLEKYIKHFRNGRDLAQRPRGLMVIDLFGLQPEEVRSRFPEVFQWVLERVKPERDQNNRASYREKWWIFGEPRKDLRPALEGLDRYIATVRTAKHRIFQFVPSDIIAESKIVVVASDVGELSWEFSLVKAYTSVGHWLLGGGWVSEMIQRYNRHGLFRTPFPFPMRPRTEGAASAELAEALDAHRKKQQATHPELTMTGMYNVLESCGRVRRSRQRRRSSTSKASCPCSKKSTTTSTPRCSTPTAAARHLRRGDYRAARGAQR